MRRAALALLAAIALPAALSSCEGAPTDVRSPEGLQPLRFLTDGSAVGDVTFSFGATTYTLEFDAEVTSGVASGWATFYSSYAGVGGVIEVECLIISGNTATLSGRIEETDDPLIYGNEAVWQVQDGTTDYATPLYIHEYNTGSTCENPGEVDLVAVSSGSITITP